VRSRALIRPTISGARNGNDRTCWQDCSDHRRVTRVGLRAGRRVPGPRLAGHRDGAECPDNPTCISIGNNDKGGFEIYRASKSALNQLMRSFAARHSGDPRTLLLMAPGWVQTDLGSPAAPLTIAQSIPGVVGTIEAQAGQGGLQYLDYQGRTVR
jgi:NAD(P)-dependent dehydrogenase (short-subunit alcohol dehydrogenase family)